MGIEKVIKGFECCIEWDSCKDCPYETPNEYDIAECTLSLHKDALSLLKEQDAVVRCKDCKHANYCSIHESKFSDDWFCADGEKR